MFPDLIPASAIRGKGASLIRVGGRERRGRDYLFLDLISTSSIKVKRGDYLFLDLKSASVIRGKGGSLVSRP